MPCGVYTRANSLFQPLDVVKPIWEVIDKFNISKAEFVGYWRNKEITVDNTELVVSYYKKNVRGKYKYLIYVSNPTNSSQSFKFDTIPLNIKTQLPEIININDNEVKIIEIE